MTQKPIKTIDHYQLLTSLGKGGMGEVFLAFDTVCERQVAFKQIREDLLKFPGIHKRFLREAKIASQLTHPSIISIYAIELKNGSPYYTMPYIEGETLKEVLKKSQAQAKEGISLHPLGGSIPALARIFLTICQAVAYAHAKGILHRDLKPENIIIGSYGEVLILDWGLAEFLSHPGKEDLKTGISSGDSDLTLPGKIVGTLSYMAPERALGQKASISTEIYALGAILYYLLTLQLPFSRTTLKAFRKQMNHERLLDPLEVAPYRDIPIQLSEIVKKALHSRAEQRYHSMQQMIADLQKYIDGEPEWTLVSSLDISNKKDWEFQENVLFAKHIAITRETDIMEWVSLMVSQESFPGNVRFEATAIFHPESHGFGMLLNIPEAGQRKGIEEGYCVWIGSEKHPGCKLFRSNIEVMHLPKLHIPYDQPVRLCLETMGNHIRFFLDESLVIDYSSHIPMRGAHIGLLYRDAHFLMQNLKVFVSSHNVMVNCLAIPDAFLETGTFSKARTEYRRIGNSFAGRTEGREALFRAGITLLEEAATTKGKSSRNKLFSLALEEFSKLHGTPGAPLEYLGKSLVYKAEGEIEEEVKCLELALRKYPKHPLLAILIEQIIFRLHESSYNNRFAAYHFALLALTLIPEIFTNPDHQRLIEMIQKHSEPLPFLETDHLILKLAFWLAKQTSLVELIQKNSGNFALIADAFFCLIKLEKQEIVDSLATHLKEDRVRSEQIELLLFEKKQGTKKALERFFSHLPISLECTSMRTLLYLFDKTLELNKTEFLQPYFETLDGYDLSMDQRFEIDVRKIWMLLQEGKTAQAGRFLTQYPLELLQQESSPLYFLFGCYLWVQEGEEIAMAHFSSCSDRPHPPTTALLSHFLLGKISLKKIDQKKLFFWEWLQLFRQLTLFYRCINEPQKAAYFQKELKLKRL